MLVQFIVRVNGCPPPSGSGILYISALRHNPSPEIALAVSRVGRRSRSNFERGTAPWR